MRHRFAGLLEGTDTTAESIRFSVAWVLSEFDDFYSKFQEITAAAKTAFETRDYQASLRISEQKLVLYSKNLYALAENLTTVFPLAARDPSLWDSIEDCYETLVSERYEADLAVAYFPV